MFYCGAVPLRFARVVLLGASSVLIATSCNALGGDVTGVSGAQGSLTLTASDSSALADRASEILLTAVVDTALPVDKRQVTFSTTAGTFDGQTSATVQPDSQRVAHAYLTAPSDSATSIVTASTANAARSLTVIFRRAPPQTVELSTDAFKIDSGFANAVKVTAVLHRVFGQPSPGYVIAFSAHARNGPDTIPIGRFSPTWTAADANQTGVSRFTLGDVTFHGVIVIRATVRSTAQPVVDSTFVTVP